MEEVAGSFRHWKDFRDSLAAFAKAFGSYFLLDRFRDVCIESNPAIEKVGLGFKSWLRFQVLFSVTMSNAI